jgi:hypothetical protein
VDQFKIDVDEIIQKRAYFVEIFLPTLVQDKDYYIIKGRKSLGKAGAEKLATIYSLVATFAKDVETMDSFRGVEGLVAYVCTLTRRSGEVAGQGRGAAVLKNNNGDANKTVKMAQKSAFIDSVIRATGLSDIFTSDLEDMNLSEIAPLPVVANVSGPENTIVTSLYSGKELKEGDRMITDKQKEFLTGLIQKRIRNRDEKQKWMDELETCTRFDASEMISSFLMISRK